MASRKGIKNNLPTAGFLRQKCRDVYNTIGGDKEFAKWAKENQTDFYKMVAGLEPKEVSGPNGRDLFDNHLTVTIMSANKEIKE